MPPRKVSIGQKRSANPLMSSASAVNNTLDAVAYYQGQMALGKGKPPNESVPNPCVVKVKNISGGDLARGKILQLGDFILTEMQNSQLWFEADTPAATPNEHRKLCVLRKPVLDGSIGEAFIAGACIASVDSIADTHTRASVTPSSSNLTSNTWGPFEILSPLDGTGVQEAVVRFDHVRAVRGQTNASHAKGATGTIRIYLGGSDTGQTITATNKYADLEANKECHCILDEDGLWYLVSGEC